MRTGQAGILSKDQIRSNISTPRDTFRACDNLPRVGQHPKLIECENGFTGPFATVSGWGPKPHMLVDDGEFEAVFNREVLHACGVDVDESFPDQEADLLHISAHSVEFWDWPPSVSSE
jgi:hypothetical protein